MQTKALGDLAVASRQYFPLVMAAMPINERERRIALRVTIFLLSAVVIVAPFANTPLAHIDAFVPVLQTAMCVVDFVTAALLFAQYTIYPKKALLAVAGGYVFSGLFAFIQTLAFPGAYSATGLIGDGINSAAWIFVLWHSSFAIAVIVYALTKDAKEAASLSGRSATGTIAIAIACILAATVGLTIGTVFLPNLFISVTQQARLANSANVFLWLLSITAFVLLFVRRRTILDLWLMVILLAWWPIFIMGIFVTAVRFSLGWYTLRCFALVASSTLLCVLLGETIALYGRLANANLRLQRERADRLISVEAATAAMAHEVRQPLAGIATNCAAGLNWLKRTPPNLEKVRACLVSTQNAGHRAEEIIAGIRALFKKTTGQRTMVQVNDVISEVLRLEQHDLKVDEISASTELHENIPQILADRTQIQQVILNLVKNAIEAMHSVSPSKRHLRVVTGFDGNSVVSVYVQDSGPGITVEDRDKIFDPFFTTKSAGMGLGLPICRTIVEDHGGSLRLAKTDTRGSSFEIAFPIASTSDSRT